MTETTQVTQADMQAAATFVEDHGWLIDEGEEWGDLHPNDQATLAKAFARHRTQALADAAAEAEPVGYIIAEMLNRRREYESNGIVMTATPQGMSTLPLYTAPSSQRALVEALEVFRSFGCPVCNGDCSGANPPVMTCPMQMADRALVAKATGDRP